MEERVVKDAIFRANRLGRNGSRVTAVIFVEAPAATETDYVVFQYDNGPQTASESD